MKSHLNRFSLEWKLLINTHLNLAVWSDTSSKLRNKYMWPLSISIFINLVDAKICTSSCILDINLFPSHNTIIMLKSTTLQ